MPVRPPTKPNSAAFPRPLKFMRYPCIQTHSKATHSLKTPYGYQPTAFADALRPSSHVGGYTRWPGERFRCLGLPNAGSRRGKEADRPLEQSHPLCAFSSTHLGYLAVAAQTLSLNTPFLFRVIRVIRGLSRSPLVAMTIPFRLVNSAATHRNFAEAFGGCIYRAGSELTPLNGVAGFSDGSAEARDGFP